MREWRLQRVLGGACDLNLLWSSAQREEGPHCTGLPLLHCSPSEPREPRPHHSYNPMLRGPGDGQSMGRLSAALVLAIRVCEET